MEKPAIGKVFLTPAALQEAAIELWGEEKWRGAFQTHLGISYSQLHRYMTVYKGQRIPQTLAMVLHLLRTVKAAGVTVPPLPMYPAADLTPVKFEWVKKPKIARPDNDAPEEDFFGLGSTAPETSAPEPEKAEQPAPKPEPAKPSRKRAMDGPETAKAGPVKGRAGEGVKAKPTAPAKTPAKKVAKT